MLAAAAAILMRLGAAVGGERYLLLLGASSSSGVAKKAGGSGKVARPPRCIYSNFISSLNYSTTTTMHTYYTQGITPAMNALEKPTYQRIVEHANSLADEVGMEREQFYQAALIEYIEKLENARTTQELNQVYKNIDAEEETLSTSITLWTMPKNT